MILLSVLLVIAATILLQDKGALTQSSVKWLVSVVLLITSGVLLDMEYGTLRAVFTLIGVLSLVGTVYTLLRYKYLKV